jgi:hypothetical protein
MGAVTFPDSKVIGFITQNVVPLLLSHDHKPLADQFHVKWTPTLITLDPDGKEHHRTVGFLAPEDLLSSLMLGRAKISFDREDFTEALKSLDALLSDYPKGGAAPEAVYMRGVCLYKMTHEAKPLKEAYEKLQAEYPQSEWTGRAYPYRLL